MAEQDCKNAEALLLRPQSRLLRNILFTWPGAKLQHMAEGYGSSCLIPEYRQNGVGWTRTKYTPATRMRVRRREDLLTLASHILSGRNERQEQNFVTLQH